MLPLVLGLQAEALDSTSSVTDLMRMAKMVAIKLGLDEFATWVTNELDGYKSADDLPPYRMLSGQLRARNPYQGWIPAQIGHQDFERTVTKLDITDPIGSLEDIVKSDKNNGTVVHHLTGTQQGLLRDMFQQNFEFQVQAPVTHINGILHQVRNAVLDWSLSLEKSGVLGEGMTFSKKEREAAKIMGGGNTFNIQNVGVFGDVTNSQVTSTQNARYSKEKLSELKTLVKKLEPIVGHLEAGTRQPVEADLEKVKDELAVAEPNPAKLQSALSSMWETCKSATSDIVAGGISEAIRSFLS